MPPVPPCAATSPALVTRPDNPPGLRHPPEFLEPAARPGSGPENDDGAAPMGTAPSNGGAGRPTSAVTSSETWTFGAAAEADSDVSAQAFTSSRTASETSKFA
ncbi:hypothetical protein GCM10023215_21450 [Pseudonocardia yuanmonensis]|uniref:Uncharacterized protein n=1 Tax=Pseudonocardia yuanmonensis TaxID=1095914 RepID=A0ABP8WBV5_9PSEU